MNFQKRIVIIGQSGSGKTTLFNRLTGANEKTACSEETVTRELVQGYSLYDTNFEVIDVPDSSSIEKGILQAAGLMASFNLGEINQIILVIRQELYEQMRQKIQQQIKPIERYLDKITIFISYFDCLDEKYQLQQEQEIRNWILKQYKIKSIIFYKKNFDDQSIIIQITNILQVSNSFNVEIDEDQILNDFAFDLDENYEILNYNSLRNSLIKEFAKFSNQECCFLYKLKQDNSNFLYILSAFREKVKDKAEECFHKYASKLREQINKVFGNAEQNYILYILLLQNLKKQLNHIFEIIDRKSMQHPKFTNYEADALAQLNILKMINLNKQKYQWILQQIEQDKIKLRQLIQTIIGNRKIICKEIQYKDKRL